MESGFRQSIGERVTERSDIFGAGGEGMVSGLCGRFWPGMGEACGQCYEESLSERIEKVGRIYDDGNSV